MKIVQNEQIERQYGFMREIAEMNRGKELRFFVRTFGCQQNEADSERIAGMCREMGYKPAPDEKSADLIVVNTCAVREHAELRALSITGQFKHLKEHNPDLLIVVCGCMVTQEHRMNDIKRSYPYVDILFGTGMLYRFPELLIEHVKKHKRQFMIDETEGNIAEGLPVLRESKIKAWVSVIYGCNNFCTYCVVPYVRGRERSRRREDIINEVKDLIADGCKEITLLGQNVNSYGKDSGDCDFADLVREICALDGDFILRFMTSHPKDASKKLIDTMAESPKCARQFHLPMQSGSARVLKAMNRCYTPEKYLEVVDYMREKMPGIAISSDIIVGFPGETDEEFNDTINMLNKVKFDMVYSFIYSPRNLTPAAKMPDQIPAEIKSARMDKLLTTQNEISLQRNLELVGKTERVLLEGESRSDKSMLTGRNDGNKLVHVPKTPETEKMIGQFAQIKITRAEPFALFGEPANN